MKNSLVLIVALLVFALILQTGQARFIQPDETIPQPYNPQSLNHYSYTLNNPYKYTDPTGREPIKREIGSVDIMTNYIKSLESGFGTKLFHSNKEQIV